MIWFFPLQQIPLRTRIPDINFDRCTIFICLASQLSVRELIRPISQILSAQLIRMCYLSEIQFQRAFYYISPWLLLNIFINGGRILIMEILQKLLCVLFLDLFDLVLRYPRHRKNFLFLGFFFGDKNNSVVITIIWGNAANVESFFVGCYWRTSIFFLQGQKIWVLSVGLFVDVYCPQSGKKREFSSHHSWDFVPVCVFLSLDQHLRNFNYLFVFRFRSNLNWVALLK